MNTEEIIKQMTEMGLEYGPKLLGAIAVLILGNWIIKAMVKTSSKIMDKSKLDASLKPFLRSMLEAVLKLLLVISVLGMIGIEMTSFIAILGAAGLAVGMALSGTLQNFAGGVMILIFKPFKVDDYIEALGFGGFVKEIQIFNTIITSHDNKTIILPNGEVAGSSLTNYSKEDKRRVDWIFGIAYGDDSDKAKAVLKSLCDGDKRILKDPEVFIAISELGDSSVNFTVRAWVMQQDYWEVYFDMNEKVYKNFEKEGLNIPYPTMDINIQK